jgi:hypothetical protein
MPSGFPHRPLFPISWDPDARRGSKVTDSISRKFSGLTHSSRRTAAVVVIGAAAVAAVGTAAPAFAGSSACPSDAVCIYDDTDYRQMLGYRTAVDGLRNISSTNNDKMSSWENKKYQDAAWYTDTNGQGDCLNMPSRRQLANVGFFDNDEASSWRTNAPC